MAEDDVLELKQVQLCGQYEFEKAEPSHNCIAARLVRFPDLLDSKITL